MCMYLLVDWGKVQVSAPIEKQHVILEEELN
jgi:hypothetical protein